MASTIYTDDKSFQIYKILTVKGNTKAGFPRKDGRIIAKGNVIEGIKAKW